MVRYRRATIRSLEHRDVDPAGGFGVTISSRVGDDGEQRVAHRGHGQQRGSHERNVIMSSQPHGGMPSLVVITVDVLVSRALAAHGRELRTR
jgi:hypothetical protein